MQETMQDAKGFFRELFDLSFTRFITIKLIKLLFIIAIVFYGLIALMIMGSALGNLKSFAGLFQLAMGPVVFLVGVISARIFLELSIVFFRIESNTAKLVEKDSTARQ
jgi:hypothetical protein